MKNSLSTLCYIEKDGQYLMLHRTVYLFRNPAVQQAEADFQETLKHCQEITLEDCRTYPMPKKIAGKVLRLFAPLM